jgi:Mrp family chromosome partitioning ATPase
MGTLLDKLGQEGHVVILDTPPVLAASDAVALAAQCDGVVLVIRSGTVPHEVVRHAVDQIVAVRARLLGVLLNRLDARRDGQYYDYYRYYRSYYNATAKQ